MWYDGPVLFNQKLVIFQEFESERPVETSLYFTCVVYEKDGEFTTILICNHQPLIFFLSAGVYSKDFLLKWVRSEVAPQPVDDLLYSFRDGTILCKILSNYTPELVDTIEFSPSTRIKNLELAIDAFEKLGLLIYFDCY